LYPSLGLFLYFYFFLFLQVFYLENTQPSLYKGMSVLFVIQFSSINIFLVFQSYSLLAYLGQLGYFSSLFVIFSLPEFLFNLQLLVSAAILRCQNNLSSARRQLVSELSVFLG
jgi:hypothetical protein